jgi:hypothetical protein
MNLELLRLQRSESVSQKYPVLCICYAIVNSIKIDIFLTKKVYKSFLMDIIVEMKKTGGENA